MTQTDVSDTFQTGKTRRSRFQVPDRLHKIGFIPITIIGLLGVILSLSQLVMPTTPLRIHHSWLDRTPITVFTARDGEPAPAVVLAHEFAGSQQLMLPFAVTLARNGYTVVTFDFPGHGRNGELFPQNDNRQLQLEELSFVLDTVVAFARQHPSSNGQVALLGHALGADTALYYAQLQPQVPQQQIEAVVALSKDYGGVAPNNPRNLLVLNGALEFWLWDTTFQVLEQSNLEMGETTGNFQNGTARRVELIPWVEHIGILFNHATVHAAQDWLDQSFGRETADNFYLEDRLIWIALLYLSAMLLFWPFSLLLKPVGWEEEQVVSAAPMNRYWWWGVTLAPMLLVPLLVWVTAADDWLHILVGGPLALHFALYGLLTGGGLLTHRLLHKSPPKNRIPTWYSLRRMLLMALLVVGYVFLIVGVPDQVLIFNYFPPWRRILIAPLVFLLILPYFLADEQLTRRPGAPKHAYAITKVLFILSLGIDGLLDQSLIALVVLSPLFALFFVVHGLFRGRMYQRTGTFLVGALANAFILAWIVTAIFPLVA